MKKLLILMLTLAFLLSACSSGPVAEPDPLAGWLEGANLDAEETPEQLYEAALEEDTLVIYSTSTRMIDVAASFEKEYPGLLARVEHIREGAMIGALRDNYDTEKYACDLVCSADGQGIMQNEFLPHNILVK